MSIGCITTHYGLSPQQRKKVKLFLEAVPRSFRTLHHKDDLGSDEEIAELALPYKYHLVSHPQLDRKLRANIYSHEVRTPMYRKISRRAVIEESKMALVLQETEGNGEGRFGADMMRAARELKRPTLFVYPSGIIAVENFAKVPDLSASADIVCTLSQLIRCQIGEEVTDGNGAPHS